MTTSTTTAPVFGLSLAARGGRDKVTGRARYAYEYEAEGAVYAWVVQSRIAKGRVRSVARDEVVGRDGVIEVLWHDNAPRLDDSGDAILQVLQSPEVAYRGQVVALVVATTPEAAREAAGRWRWTTTSRSTTLCSLLTIRVCTRPGRSMPATQTDSVIGDAAAAYVESAVRVDATYTTPAEHNNPMEPHATTAAWDGERLRLYDSNQGGHAVRAMVAKAFGLDPGPSTWSRRTSVAASAPRAPRAPT